MNIYLNSNLKWIRLYLYIRFKIFENKFLLTFTYMYVTKFVNFVLVTKINSDLLE